MKSIDEWINIVNSNQKLVDNGVSKKRLDYQGFGEQFSKNKNVDEAERELNRRTEFYIIKK